MSDRTGNVSEFQSPEKANQHLKRPKDYAYEVRRIGPEDFSLLIPLMKDCFGMDADIGYFRWKYTQNPAGDFIGFVAIDGFTGAIGGYYGVIPQIFELDGKRRVIYQSCDTMTHSLHRRRGLFQRLAIHCYNELKAEGKLFVIGFGGGQSTPGFLKFGWKRVFDYRYYFKPALFCRFSKCSESVRQELIVTTAINAIQEGLDVSRNDISARAKGVRTQQQIQWRLQNPNHKYLALRLKRDDSSYILFYVDKDKLVIFDMVSKSLESGRKMVGFLSREVVRKGFRGIISFCQENGSDSEMLKKLGFISNPFNFGPLSERVPFIFYGSEEEMEQYLSASAWQVTTYDHDSL